MSYNRPFNTRASTPEDWVFNAEYPMVRWLERNGYDVSYSSGIDTARRGQEILEHKVFLSVGHDEYWSGDQRANVEAARDAGVSLAFFSGNEVFWKTRWEAASMAHTPYSTLVSYKETLADAKIDPLKTCGPAPGATRGSAPLPMAAVPRTRLTGTIFTVNCCTYAYRGAGADAEMRFWRDTSIAALTAGQTATLSSATLGLRVGRGPGQWRPPRRLFHMSSTTVDVPQRILDYARRTARAGPPTT